MYTTETETEGQRDRETERQRDRETERERERNMHKIKVTGKVCNLNFYYGFKCYHIRQNGKTSNRITNIWQNKSNRVYFKTPNF